MALGYCSAEGELEQGVSMTPVVSVIMPAFNTGRWIQKAIESVLDQTLTDVEVLVVDDGSTDNTVEVVRGIRDERVRLFCQPRNCGVSAARNRALDEAQGRWMAILDSDDWFARRDRLASLVALGEEHNADMVADDLYLVEDDKDYAWTTLLSEKKLRFEKPQWIDLLMFVRHDLGPIKPLLRIEFLRKHRLRYNESLRIAEDWAFYVECLLAGGRLILAPWAGYVYRMRQGSLTRGVLSLLNQAEFNLRHYLEDHRLKAYPEVLAVLQKQLAMVRENRRYYRVMAPLKEKKLARGLVELAHTPDFLWLFVRRLPRIVSYRVRHRLVRLDLPR
jgi:succinoglycan biosynthesis protein ExoO